MKKSLLVILLILSLMITFETDCLSAGVFEISIPDMMGGKQNFQSATLGLNMGNIRLSGGVDVGHLSLTMRNTVTREEDLNEETISDSSVNVSGNMIIPGGEAKLFLASNTVRPYINGGFFKSFSSVDIGLNSDQVDENSENYEQGQEEINKIEENISDALNFWGTKVGFGAEYKINDHIALSGEAGMRLLFHSFDYEDEYENEYDNYVEKTRSEVSSRFGATYTKGTITFYY